MPINVFPEITRRQWMKRSLAAGLGSLWTLDQAEAAAGQTELWALFSDPHIAADPAQEARGVRMSQHLQRCVKQVLGAGGKPFGVLINGDCALTDGQPGDYVQLERCLQALRDERVQVHCTLGNHDDRKHFRDAFSQPGVEPVLAEKHVTILSSARLNWVLLDSLDQVNVTPGKIGGGQLGWLKRTLGKIPRRPTFVMVHHNPPIDAPENLKHMGLQDSDALLDLLAGMPQVKALFYGHTHAWHHQPPQQGRPWLINLPAVSYVFQESQPSGWVLARADDDGMTLELRSLNPNHDAHREKVRIDFT